MGITTEEFFENIYSVIFSPKSFFERNDMKMSVRLALATIIFVAFISKLASGIIDNSIREPIFILFLIWNILKTTIFWFLTALFFEYIGKIFDRGNNFEKILFYSAFAPIPYIFFAPLNLIKTMGNLGYILSVILELIIYFWIIILYAYSLRAAYKLTISRSFMLIFLPFIGSFFAINWMIGFISKIWYIFTI